MLNKFFKFLKGYVIIGLYGNNTERFVNICIRRNIHIGFVSRSEDEVRICVMKGDFPLLRPVARKTHTRVKILKKCGLYNLIGRYGRRYALILGTAAAAAFFFICSGYIWTVEINGAENIDCEKLCGTLRECGIYAGAKKKNLIGGTEIKNKILSENDGIAWAWVYIDGAKATVEVYEKIIPPSVTDRNAPCDIIAACDGYIKNIIVKNGHAEVQKGDIVCVGDVLISGTVPIFKKGIDTEERYMQVHAMGTVEAYTSHHASGVYKLYYESRIPTGKSKRRCRAEIFGKSFKLFLKESISFENYDKIENRYELKLPFIGYTGLAWSCTSYSEVSVKREPISVDSVMEFAKNELEEKISKELLYDAALTDSSMNYSYIDDETVKAELTMNFIEKIGTEQSKEE